MTIDVRAFGAKGDGTTDDLPAFNAARAAAKLAGTQAGTVFSVNVTIPAGVYRMAGDLVLPDPIALVGEGLGFFGNSASALVFDRGFGVLIGGHAMLTHLRVVGVPPVALIPQWMPGTQYGAGAFVRFAGDNRWLLRCLAGGVSGAAPPITPKVAQVVAPRALQTWAPGTPFATGPIGDVVWNPADPTRVYWPSHGGVSAAAQPNFNPVVGGSTTDGSVTWRTFAGPSGGLVVDGGVVWEVRNYSGVFMADGAVLDDVSISGFANAGVFAQGGLSYAPPRNVNRSKFRDIYVSFCGAGIAVNGDDANVTYLSAPSFSNIGQTWVDRVIPGDGGVGNWDRSFLGMTSIGAHAESCSGAGLVADSQNARSVHVAYYSENAVPDDASGGGVMVGGVHAAGYSAGSTSAVYGTDLAQGHVERWPLKKHAWARLGRLDTRVAVFEWSDADEYSSNAFGWHKDTPLAAGWWWFGMGYSSSYPALAYSGSKAAEGAGHLRICKGYFVGQNAATDYYVGLGPGEKTSSQVRGGRRLVGDRFDEPGGYVVGGARYVGMRCDAPGWDAPPWKPGAFHGGVADVYGLFASTCQPRVPNGFVYGISGPGGVGGATDPAWPPQVGATVADGVVTWVCLGPIAHYEPYSKIGP